MLLIKSLSPAVACRPCFDISGRSWVRLASFALRFSRHAFGSAAQALENVASGERGSSSFEHGLLDRT